MTLGLIEQELRERAEKDFHADLVAATTALHELLWRLSAGVHGTGWHDRDVGRLCQRIYDPQREAAGGGRERRYWERWKESCIKARTQALSEKLVESMPRQSSG